MQRRRKLCAFLATPALSAAVAGTCAVAARAADTSWTNASGNMLWSDPANWSAGVPGPDDRAILEAAAGTIDLGGVNRQAGTVMLGDNFHLANGLLDTTFLTAGAGSTYQVFTSGPSLRVSGAIGGQIVDRPGGGGFNVGLSGTLTAAQAYTGRTYVVRPLEITGAGALGGTAGVSVLDDIRLLGPIASPTALGGNVVSLLGQDLRLVSPSNTSLSVQTGPIAVDQGASSISFFATGPFVPSAQIELSADALTRATGAALRVGLDALQPGLRFKLDQAPQLSGGGSAATERGILPYVTGTSLPFSGGLSFFTYDRGADPSNPSDDVGLRPLDLNTEYAPAIPPGTSTANVRLTTNHVLSADATINSLSLPVGGSVTLAGASLTIASGGLILGGASSPPTGASTVIGGNGAVAVPGELIVHTPLVASSNAHRFVIDVPIHAATLTTAGTAFVAFTRANSFAGAWLNQGRIVSGAQGALGTGTIRLGDADLYFESGPQTFDAPLVFDRPQNPFGPVFGYQSELRVSTAGDVVTFVGPLSGSGAARTSGPGLLRLNGDATFSTFVFAVGSNVEINGTWRATDAGGLSVPFDFFSPGVLAGTGVILGEVRGDGTIAPGAVGDALGRLTIDRVQHGAGPLVIDVAGDVADELAVLSFLNLTGHLLDVNFLADPTLGDEFRIIDNRFAGAITGTFTGLPEGSTFLADGWNFRITYLGGDGNDVVLTAVVPEPAAGVGVLVALGTAAGRRRRSVS